MSKISVICLCIFSLLSIGPVYSQNINPTEIDNLSIFSLNFGLRPINAKEIVNTFGETYIAVKFKDLKLYNPNTKKYESLVDYFYIYSENKSNRTLWGLVTLEKIFGNKGQMLYEIVVPTNDEIIGLSHEVIEYPLSLSFFAKESKTNKTYITESEVILGFDMENKTLKIVIKDY